MHFQCVSGSSKTECLVKARDSLQKAVCLCSSNHSFWNALGVACSLSGEFRGACVYELNAINYTVYLPCVIHQSSFVTCT